MDSPNLELVFKNHQKQHKHNPITILGELVQKRREVTQQTRKSHRLTQFDYGRGLLPVQRREPTPEKLTDIELKAQQRRLQLEKWKEEREKQKKEMLLKKKKPFVSAVASKATIPVVPPPIPTKAGPSANRRVTRSQANKKNEKDKENIEMATKFDLPKNVRFTGNYSEKFKVPLIKFTKPSKEKPVAVTFEPVKEKSLNKPDRETNKRKTETSNRMAKQVTEMKNPSKNLVKKYSIESTSSSSSSIEKPDIKIKRTGKDKNQNIAITKSLPLKNKVLNRKVENKTIPDSSSSSDEPQKKKPVRATKGQRLIAVKPAKELTATLELPKRSSRVTRTQSQGLNPSENLLNPLSQPDEAQKKRSVRASRSQSQLITKSEIEPNNLKKVLDKTKIKKTKAVSTPTSGIPKSESSSEERLRHVSQKHMSAMSPEEMRNINTSMNSPCVTLSRGKDRARKEMKMKIKEGLLDEDASNMEDVSSFRLQLNSEISRLTELSDMWEVIMKNTKLPVFVQEQILSAVGLARLLMSSKLKQFEGLMRRCEERDVSGGLITPADLQGFWDMVFIQIVNVDMSFQKLDQLQSNNWKEVKVQPQKQQSKQMKNLGPAKPKMAVESKLKDVIAARRKANNQLDHNHLNTEIKTFEGGFFKVTSPVRSPSGLATPKNNSMLKNVLSTEAKKASASVSKANTSMAMLRASLFGKNTGPDIEGIAPLPLTPAKTPINLKATPARSILKSAKKDLTTAKLSKTVLFNKSDLDHDDDKENYYDANQHIQGADSGVSSMEAEKDMPHREIVQNKSKKTKLVRQEAFDTETSNDDDRSSYYSSNEATPVQRAAKIKALQAIEAKLKHKRTPKKVFTPKTPRTPITPKTPRFIDDEVDINTPRRSTRISMRVIN